MSKETLFYDVIKNMFIGTKTDCQDRFTNLMKIKEKYYEMLEDTLKNNIDEVLKKYPSFRDELFDMLYSFFSRYVTENGSIYYTDTKDVTLFWKTQMYYYVKTNKLCKSIPT
jgi:protein involved in sex pheromone biosynthesis